MISTITSRTTAARTEMLKKADAFFRKALGM